MQTTIISKFRPIYLAVRCCQQRGVAVCGCQLQVSSARFPRTLIGSYSQPCISPPNQFRWLRTFTKNPLMYSEGKYSSTDDPTQKQTDKDQTNTEETQNSPDKKPDTPTEYVENTEKLSVFQRFKKTYKEHGKVLVGVHIFTSSIWFGSFFYAAKVGVDVIPVMEWLGISERVISPFRSSSLGDIALAYLMYKLATPARYTVTLAGTNLMIKYLRKAGRIAPKKESESFRSLAKDSRKEVSQRTNKLRLDMKHRTTKLQTDFNSRRKGLTSRVKSNVKLRQTSLRDKLKNRRKQLSTGIRRRKN
ncbi:F210A-like protein [Mya arenaria]|uniref:F210A-like protein n=1 Tax=Mya arenaria TaxID=6604 RepID=A0ABY7EV31_MYAAR|nr:protein FAM210A-like [Mya arenaria]WAR13150.1 F210A-like protein [Mya arenaria]